MAGHGRPWSAMAGHGRSWLAMAGHGQPWSVMVGHGWPWPALVSHCHVHFHFHFHHHFHYHYHYHVKFGPIQLIPLPSQNRPTLPFDGDGIQQGLKDRTRVCSGRVPVRSVNFNVSGTVFTQTLVHRHASFLLFQTLASCCPCPVVTNFTVLTLIKARFEAQHTGPGSA